MSEAGRILVVDDEPANLMIMRAALESEGHTVFVAQDGREALDRLEEAAPDLVFLDWRMPGMNGAETLLRLRERTCAPIAVVTAFTSRRDMILAAGVDGFLEKPFEIDALRSLAVRLLKRNRETQ